MKVRVYKVRAFASGSGGGNMAGVVLGADDLSPQLMQAIAKKVGFSETAFIFSSKVATKKVRFFTPTEEVDLCGHATIAAWSLLYDIGIVGEGTYTQKTNAGTLSVEIDGVGLIYMQQKNMEFFESFDAGTVAPLLGLKAADFISNLVPQVVSTGLKDLMVVVRNNKVLHDLRPDFDAITKFSYKYRLIGIHVAALDARNPYNAEVRNFAPAVGIPEESATGTSNGALLCYLLRHGKLPKQEVYAILQGKIMGKPSEIYGKFKGDQVWIGGKGIAIGAETLTV